MVGSLRVASGRPVQRDVHGETFASIRSVSPTFSATLSIILLLRLCQLPLRGQSPCGPESVKGSFLVRLKLFEDWNITRGHTMTQFCWMRPSILGTSAASERSRVYRFRLAMCSPPVSRAAVDSTCASCSMWIDPPPQVVRFEAVNFS